MSEPPSTPYRPRTLGLPQRSPGCNGWPMTPWLALSISRFMAMAHIDCVPIVRMRQLREASEPSGRLL